MIKRLVAAGLAVLLAPATVLAAAPAAMPAPYVAVYSVSWSGTALGEGTITLAPQMEKDCYRYESQTKPLAPIRWFYGSPRETSLFCMDGARLRSHHFEYHNDKRDKDNFSIDFDWQAHKVKVLRRGELTQRDVPEESYDRFAMQMAVRLWAAAHAKDENPQPQDFVMADDDRITTYRWAITGREKVEVPAGSFDTLRVERIDDPRKTLRSWLSPERDYLPVKIERIEDGKVKLRMLLK